MLVFIVFQKWSIGRVIDKIAAVVGLQNDNNRSTEKVRPFGGSNL